MTIPTDLTSKLARLISESPTDEALELKVIMSLAAGGIEPVDGLGSRKQKSAPALALIVNTLSATDTTTPLWWQGRPDFLSNSLLSNLASESDEICTNAHRNNFCWLHKPGKVAIEFANSKPFAEFIDQFTNGLSVSLLMYTFYKETGDRLDIHLDDPSATLTALLMVRHKRAHDGSRSRLLIVKPDASVDYSELVDGEMIVFEGSRILHGREPLGQGEYIALLTFVFRSAPKKCYINPTPF